MATKTAVKPTTHKTVEPKEVKATADNNNVDIHKLNIFQRMLAATAEISAVAKNIEVGSGRNAYKAVSEADVLAAVKPIEERYGIYSYPFSRNIIKDERYVLTSTYEEHGEQKTVEKASMFVRVETVYRFINTDKPTEYVDITTYGDGVDSQDKAPGKAMTYGDKYALLKAYKIRTGDDPDENVSGEMKPVKQNGKDEKPKVDKPTKELLQEASDLGIDLNGVAQYFKLKSTEDITAPLLAQAIATKKKALANKKAKEEAVKKAQEQAATPTPENTEEKK